MIFSRLRVWVIYSNGNAYSWKMSRAAAYAERRVCASIHPHARWTVGEEDADLRLLGKSESPADERDGCAARQSANTTPTRETER